MSPGHQHGNGRVFATETVGAEGAVYDDRVFVPHYQLPPTEQAPGARVDKDGDIRRDPYRWGFVPNWVRDVAEFKLTTINARAGSVAKAKTYAASSGATAARAGRPLP